MWRISWLFLMSCLVGLSGAVAPAGSPSEDAAEQRRALVSLRATIVRIQAQIQAAQGQRSEVSQALQRSEVQIGKISRRLALLHKEHAAQQRRLSRLRTLEKTQQQALHQQRAILEQQIQAAYRMGHQEQLKLMLNQQDPSQFSRMMTYYGYMNRARMARMHALESQLRQLTETQQQIVTQQQQLLGLQKVQSVARDRLHRTQQTRHQALRDINQSLQHQGNRLRQVEANAQQMQRLIDQLQQALAAQAQQQKQKFAKQRGRLDWPTDGRVAHSFGSHKVGDIRWDGMLIRAKAGQPVAAIHAGRVVFADWLRGVGLLVILDHGDGYMSLYGHNQHISQKVGDWVAAGETIALVGETGGQRVAGLYFAIRHAGIAMDPGQWVRK